MAPGEKRLAVGSCSGLVVREQVAIAGVGIGASPKRRPGWDFPPKRRKTASDAAAPRSTSLAQRRAG